MLLRDEAAILSAGRRDHSVCGRNAVRTGAIIWRVALFGAGARSYDHQSDRGSSEGWHKNGEARIIKRVHNPSVVRIRIASDDMAATFNELAYSKRCTTGIISH